MSVKNRKDTRNFFAFAGISIIGFLAFYIYPIVRTIYLSFTNTSIMDPIHTMVGWKNFERAIKYDDVFHLALKNTFKYDEIKSPIEKLNILNLEFRDRCNIFQKELLSPKIVLMILLNMKSFKGFEQRI